MKNPCNELKKAGQCLYATVPSDVADDVMSRITAVCDRHDKMVEMLKEFEWADCDQCGDPSCRECGRHIAIGHADDCELAALLKEDRSNESS
jgi:hypothetical protein